MKKALKMLAFFIVGATHLLTTVDRAAYSG
jgi:hypothetical protein